MDCLNARRLLQKGDAAREPDRDAALEHLDRCAECAALAPSLDPLLLFRRLPQLAVSVEEATRMSEAVAVLRRAPADPPPARPAGVALRLAAAIVAAGGLWLAPGPVHVDPAVATAAPQAPEARLAGPVPLPEYQPSVETIGSTDAYIATQVSEDDLTLVILANVDVAGR
jgi:hypothetical protein